MKQANNNIWRFNFIRNAAMFFLFILIARLVQLQLFDPNNLEGAAEMQYQRKVKLPAERGKIVDRNSKLLAFNIPTISVGAFPKVIKDVNGAAQKLAPVLGLSKAAVLDMLNPQNDYVTLARKLSFDLKERIDDLKIEGISCDIILSRKYPKKQIASQLIGFTDVDGKGISGLELKFDNSLSGVPGKVVMQKSAKDNLFSRHDYPHILPEDGNDIVLTIDYRYQNIAEKELHSTIVESDAVGGVALVMNPKTGQVLAMASEPGFDPNYFNSYTAESWRPKAITDVFEPGSTFKVVTMAALLNEGVHTPNDLVFCEESQFKYKDVVIHDTKPFSWLTLREVMINSSNIGTAKLALDLKPGTLYEYARAFGFGNNSDFELIGEREGTLRSPGEWSGVSQAFIAMGHEMTATSLQMCNMFNVIANGGYLMQPTLVQEVRKDGKPVYISRPKVIRRVISKTTVDTLKNIMVEAVEQGTGKKAAIENMRICGKTGTAQMANTGSNVQGYKNGHYIASFGGFFPEKDPKLCIFVMVEKPRNGYYGGDISAPCFKKIAEQIINIEGMDYFTRDDIDTDQRIVQNDNMIVPNLIGCSKSVVNYWAKQEKKSLTASGNGEFILAQDPKPGTLLEKDTRISVESAALMETDQLNVVPDVTGLPLRNALNVLSANDIRVIVDGSGKVVRQQPKAGHKLKNNEQVLLHCESSVNLKDLLVLN